MNERDVVATVAEVGAAGPITPRGLRRAVAARLGLDTKDEAVLFEQYAGILKDAKRRQQAQRADAARQKELQQAASQQYRENRRFRAARVREERERISEGGCADDVVVEADPRDYREKLADQYRENRAKARSYERRAREDLEGPCVDLRGAARGAANLEKRMREKREKEAHDRDLRDALAEEAARYQAEARHAKQAVALDFTEAPRRKPPRRLTRQAGPPPEEGAD